MTFVKICGLSTPEHVEAAVQSGAAMIGFVFANSKRRVSVELAQQLAALIPSDVKKVGVFVNSDADTIQHIYNSVPLDYVQYHGDETNEFIQSVGLPAIKAFSIHSEQDAQQTASYDVDYYLCDTPGTDFRGGSGHTFDWSLLQGSGIDSSKLIVAGGLHAGNVIQAITTTHAVGVDVSSGVERDGVKDSTLITQFISTVKGARI